VSLVLDASVTLAWFFVEEGTPATRAALDRVVEEGAVVPPLWRVEVSNVLRTAVRRGRLALALRDKALFSLGSLPIEIDPDCDRFAWTLTIALSDRFDLTTYDATYLELAERRSLPLATQDLRLIAAAKSLGVRLIGDD
jgi:predicted nucleic acid-binding protein